jgi:D-glycerate 3-kinase
MVCKVLERQHWCVHDHADYEYVKILAVRDPVPNETRPANNYRKVSILNQTLASPPHALPTAVLSIDDLYLRYDDQIALAAAHPSNPLVQHRGEPSTHDLTLGRQVFAAIKAGEPAKLPVYDKSAHNGSGDRAPENQWIPINQPSEPKIKVVIFEGWCVGFRALKPNELEQKRLVAIERAHCGDEKGELWKHDAKSLQFINSALKDYDDLTNSLNAFVHIDAEDVQYVYGWRLEQEAKLRDEKGSGMSDNQVIEFVNGCKYNSEHNFHYERKKCTKLRTKRKNFIILVRKRFKKN